uniref:Uncharacterized protein n=1 Tax=Molossus molossus TaxID=27622 RepID=A0A7J8FT31_MOLMO|nr:hypothetical protein HJG59_008434 [Molossus molossus]
MLRLPAGPEFQASRRRSVPRLVRKAPKKLCQRACVRVPTSARWLGRPGGTAPRTGICWPCAAAGDCLGSRLLVQSGAAESNESARDSAQPGRSTSLHREGLLERAGVRGRPAQPAAPGPSLNPWASGGQSHFAVWGSG